MLRIDESAAPIFPARPSFEDRPVYATLRHAYRSVQQPALTRVLVRSLCVNGGHRRATSPIGAEGFDTSGMRVEAFDRAAPQLIALAERTPWFAIHARVPNGGDVLVVPALAKGATAHEVVATLERLQNIVSANAARDGRLSLPRSRQSSRKATRGNGCESLPSRAAGHGQRRLSAARCSIEAEHGATS